MGWAIGVLHLCALRNNRKKRKKIVHPFPKPFNHNKSNSEDTFTRRTFFAVSQI